VTAADNQLHAFPAHAHLPLLRHLDLSGNAFAAWPQLPPLPHLRWLSVADNSIQCVPPLHGMWQLRGLDLGFNALQALPATLAALAAAPQLAELQLHDNPDLLQQWRRQRQEQRAHGHPAGVRAPGERDADEVAAGAPEGTSEAAAFDMWLRAQVAAALPWLAVLDNTPLCARAVQGQHPQHQQLMAVGRQLACSSACSALLMRKVRQGVRLGLPLPLQQGSGAGQAGVTAMHHAALHAAAALAPYCLLPCAAGAHGFEQAATLATPAHSCSHVRAALAGRAGEAGTQGSGAWLEQLEAAWCCSTRRLLVQQHALEQLQQRQQQAAREAAPQLSVWAHAEACALVQQHLQQLQQLVCWQHQYQLHQLPCFVQEQQQWRHAGLHAAAELLQAAWRARAARLQHKAAQQRAVAAAATVLQRAWRVCLARAALASASQEQRQQQEQHRLLAAARRADAAAATIQAVVRGRRVRQRLRAALAAARATHASAEQGGSSAGDVDADAGDAWELPELPDDVMGPPPELGHELAQHGVSAGSTLSAHGIHWLMASGGRDTAASATWAERSDTVGATAAAPTTAAVSRDAAACPDAGTGSFDGSADSACSQHTHAGSCGGDGGGSGGTAVAGHEGRIQALMSEWGFADRGTAEAYLR
jgi:hypothetical protein